MPATTSALSASDVDTSKIQIKDPKKDDDVYVCRIHYNGQKKMELSMTMVRIVEIKESVAYIRLPKEWLRTLLEIEDAALRIAKNKASTWFNNRLTEDIVEEYFSSSIIVHKKYGQVLKVTCRNSVSGLVCGTLSNIVLNLNSLKFYKKKFNLVWSIDEQIPIRTLDADEDSSIEEFSEEDIEFMGPDCHDMDAIHSSLVARGRTCLYAIRQHHEKLKAQLESCETSLARVQEALDTLSSPTWKKTNSALDRIHELFLDEQAITDGQ